MKKQINSVWLVAEFLKSHKKTYIHQLKTNCKANNPMARIMSLRNRYKWKIATIYEGIKKGVAVYHYTLINEGLEVKKYK